MIEAEKANELEALEGDEGEPEIGRHRDVGHEILATSLGEVKSAPAATVRADAPLSSAVEVMRARKASAVVVVDGGAPERVVGILTEHDLVERALGSPGWAGEAVSRHMTSAPETLRPQDPVAYALNRMSAGGYRHVPLVDDQGRPAGMVSANDLLRFLVELCPEEVMNLPPEPELAVHRRAEGE